MHLLRKGLRLNYAFFQRFHNHSLFASFQISPAFQKQLPYGTQRIAAFVEFPYQLNSLNNFLIKHPSAGRRNLRRLEQTDHEVVLQRLPGNASFFCGGTYWHQFFLTHRFTVPLADFPALFTRASSEALACSNVNCFTASLGPDLSDFPQLREIMST